MLYYIQKEGRKTLQTRKGKTMTKEEMMDNMINAYGMEDSLVITFCKLCEDSDNMDLIGAAYCLTGLPYHE